MVGLSKLLLKNSTISSLDNSVSDSVCSINIGNQASNLYGGPEASIERESNIVEVFNFVVVPFTALIPRVYIFP